MPRDSALEMRGTVTLPADPDAELVVTGHVTGASPAPELVVTGTVSGLIHDAATGPHTYHGVELRINGVAVPEGDLAGPIEISEDIDSPNAAIRFSLRGRSYSMARTLLTWSRVGVELIGYHSQIGGPEVSTIEFRGFLVAGSGNQRGGHEPVLELAADTRAALGDDTLCAEIPPGSGLTRAGVVAAVVPELAVSAPGGTAHSRGVVVANQRPAEFLRAIGEPVGWSWRCTPDPAGFLRLEGYVADLVHPAQSVSTWSIDDSYSIDVRPPRQPLSQVLARGVRTRTSTSVTEGGVEIETQTVEISKPYARRRAVAEQLTDGSVVPLSATSTEADQVVQRLQTETHRQGGRELLVITREYGFDNPLAAVLRTPKQGEPDGPEDGYYRTRAYLDEDGEARYWRQEKWGLRSERRVKHSYDPATGQRVSTEIEDYRSFARSEGVRPISAGAPGDGWVVGVPIGSDDQSYAAVATSGDRIRIESFGLAERHSVYPRFEGGAEVGKTEKSWAYYAPRGAVDVDGHYLRYDGSAQVEIVANWRQVREAETHQGLTSDKRLSTKTEATRGWHALIKKNGIHDWGGSDRSNRASEIFRTLERKVTVFRRLGDGSTEVIRVSTERPPEVETVPDSTVPLPLFADSEWTLAREEPFEAVLTDDSAAALWGPASHVLESDYLTSDAEALTAAARALRRSQARTVEVSRPRALERPGETVRVKDPHQHLDARLLLTAARRRFEPATGRWDGDYTLELYL